MWGCGIVCVWRGGGVYHCYRASRLTLYGHTGVLGSGRSPFGEAHGAGQGCVPVLPLDQCDMHLGQTPARCPRTTLEVGVVAPWLPPGQRHGISSTSPSSPCCPACCLERRRGNRDHSLSLDGEEPGVRSLRAGRVSFSPTPVAGFGEPTAVGAQPTAVDGQPPAGRRCPTAAPRRQALCGGPRVAEAGGLLFLKVLKATCRFRPRGPH